MKNLTRLAKLFDKFIEVGDSFVMVEDIRAIRRKCIKSEATNDPVAEGMEVITPYGSYEDTTESFYSFRQRINDIREALKETTIVEKRTIPLPEVSPTAVVNANSIPSISRQDGSRVIQLGEGVYPEPESKPKMPLQVTISVDDAGARGNLPVDEGWKIVDREHLIITHPSGNQIARGSEAGTVDGSDFGDYCSGIVYESGKYQLAFKSYNTTSAVVHYFVQKR